MKPMPEDWVLQYLLFVVYGSTSPETRKDFKLTMSEGHPKEADKYAYVESESTNGEKKRLLHVERQSRPYSLRQIQGQRVANSCRRPQKKRESWEGLRQRGRRWRSILVP
ncbi:unnamed protein product [Discosporangium mesarthrocarpum]